MERKIDVNNSSRALAICLKTTESSDLKNQKIILQYDHDNKMVGLGERRRLKVLNHLRILDGWFKKPFVKLDRKDLSVIIEQLREDKLKKSAKLKASLRKNENYAEQTKSDYVKIFRAFLRWTFKKELYKGSETNRDFIADFVYRKDKKKKPETLILSLEQAKLLASKGKTLKYRTAVMVLFDSGARPEEFANIRMKDIIWDNAKKKYYVNIRHNKESSHPRNVDMNFCNDLLSEYLETIKNEKRMPDSPVFDISLTKFREFIQRHAISLFGLKATLYTLRHSSIQHYCEIYKGNLTWLCNRFGWSYGTGAIELQTYMNRSKCAMPDGTELAHIDKIANMSNDLMRMQNRNEMLDKTIENMQKQMERLERARYVDRRISRRSEDFKNIIGKAHKR